jgi:quercetin dioxygenase-like cupin family protein
MDPVRWIGENPDVKQAVEILRWGPIGEREMRSKMEALGYPATRWVYSPGTVFDTHTHDDDKLDAVVSGRFALTMCGETVVLEAGDALYVPRGTAHRAEVVGDEPVVSLDGIAANRSPR